MRLLRIPLYVSVLSVVVAVGCSIGTVGTQPGGTVQAAVSTVTEGGGLPCLPPCQRLPAPASNLTLLLSNSDGSHWVQTDQFGQLYTHLPAGRYAIQPSLQRAGFAIIVAPDHLTVMSGKTTRLDLLVTVTCLSCKEGP